MAEKPLTLEKDFENLMKDLFDSSQDANGQDEPDGKFSQMKEKCGNSLSAGYKKVVSAATKLGNLAKKTHSGDREKLEKLISEDSVDLDKFEKEYINLCDKIIKEGYMDSYFFGLLKLLTCETFFATMEALLSLHSNPQIDFTNFILIQKKIILCYKHFLCNSNICNKYFPVPKHENRTFLASKSGLSSFFTSYVSCKISVLCFKIDCLAICHNIKEWGYTWRFLQLMFTLFKSQEHRDWIKMKIFLYTKISETRDVEFNIDDHMNQNGLQCETHEIIWCQKIVIFALCMINQDIKEKKNAKEMLNDWYKGLEMKE